MTSIDGKKGGGDPPVFAHQDIEGAARRAGIHTFGYDPRGTQFGAQIRRQ